MLEKILSGADLRQIAACVGKTKTKIDADNLQRLLLWTEEQERHTKYYNSFIAKFNTMYFAKWKTYTAKYGEKAKPHYKIYTDIIGIEFYLEVESTHLEFTLEVVERYSYKARIREYYKFDLINGWNDYLESYVKFYVDFFMNTLRESNEVQAELLTELMDMFVVEKEIHNIKFNTLESMYYLS